MARNAVINLMEYKPFKNKKEVDLLRQPLLFYCIAIQFKSALTFSG
jgi:hypothetical protein